MKNRNLRFREICRVTELFRYLPVFSARQDFLFEKNRKPWLREICLGHRAVPVSSGIFRPAGFPFA
jgi:hypothetical protein